MLLNIYMMVVQYHSEAFVSYGNFLICRFAGAGRNNAIHVDSRDHSSS